MAMALLQSRALSGCRAFAPARTGAKAERAVVAHGARRKDSYMLEVNVGEDDSEDNAVRQFMNCVMESNVLEQLRWRRYKETNQERIKRRTKERHAIRKNKIEERDWEEWYGKDSDPHAFDMYFKGGNSDDPEEVFLDTEGPNEVFGDLQYADSQFGGYAGGNQQGGYMDAQGGYMDAQGGYIQPQGGYTNQQGGYMNQQGGYMGAAGAQGGYMAGSQGYQGGYMVDARNPQQQQPQQQQSYTYSQQPGGEFVQQPGAGQ